MDLSGSVRNKRQAVALHHENFVLTRRGTVSFSRRILLHAVVLLVFHFVCC